MVTYAPIPSGAGSNTATQTVKLVDAGGTSITDSTAHAAKVLQVDASGNPTSAGDTTAFVDGGTGQTPLTKGGAYYAGAGDNTVYSITASKNFYCSAILINSNNGTGEDCSIKDGSTTLFRFQMPATVGANLIISFGSVPCVFDTSLIFNTPNGRSYGVTFVGFEA